MGGPGRYVGASAPASMVSGAFDQARAAWAEAGRDGEPRLVAIAYFAFTDVDGARGNIRDYYSFMGDAADGIAAGLHGSAAAVKEAVSAFEDAGADELIFNPGLDDLAEIARLADTVF